MGVILRAKTTWNLLPRAPSGTPPHRHTPPLTVLMMSYYSEAATLSDITAHSSGQTARDKPDECFSVLKVLDIKNKSVQYADKCGPKDLEVALLLHEFSGDLQFKRWH